MNRGDPNLPLTKEDCYTTSGKYCACIEFHLTEHKRRGFPTSQLMDYTLEPNPDAEDDNGGRAQSQSSFRTHHCIGLGEAEYE